MQPKQLIETYKAKDGRNIEIRTPDCEDVEGLMNYINGLVDEGAPISTNEKQNHISEIQYLADEVQKILEGKLIALVAISGQKIVAHAEIRRGSGRASHVGTLGIGVAKEYRDLGIGQELIRLLIKLANSQGYRLIKLEVYAHNAPAIHVYRKFGFVETGVIPKMGLFANGYEDALIMCLEL
ncbi:MAG: GNAT family N-acetyltransferase [Conexivisphaerales archaeon]|nr:GNAT family N-acetyltransferase [Conexivisphaerales archaeon]